MQTCACIFYWITRISIVMLLDPLPEDFHFNGIHRLLEGILDDFGWVLLLWIPLNEHELYRKQSATRLNTIDINSLQSLDRPFSVPKISTHMRYRTIAWHVEWSQMSRSCWDMISVKQTSSLQTWRSNMYMLVGSDFRHVTTAHRFSWCCRKKSCTAPVDIVNLPLFTGRKPSPKLT